MREKYFEFDILLFKREKPQEYNYSAKLSF